jgi:hypothetical protein
VYNIVYSIVFLQRKKRRIFDQQLIVSRVPILIEAVNTSSESMGRSQNIYVLHMLTFLPHLPCKENYVLKREEFIT